jgi:hypothetical protein
VGTDRRRLVDYAAIMMSFRYLTGIVLVVSACANIWHFREYVSNLPPRESDDRIIWERRLDGIRDALLKAGYTTGNIGYMPAGVLNGNKRTAKEDVDWVQVRYALIPLNVLQDSLEPPFVIAELSGNLDGFRKVYEGNNGWVLLQRKSQ